MIKKSVFESRILLISIFMAIASTVIIFADLKTQHNLTIITMLVFSVYFSLTVFFYYKDKKKFSKYKFDFNEPFEWFPEFYTHRLIRLIDEEREDRIKLIKYRETHLKIQNANFLSKLFHYLFTDILNTIRERIVFYEGADIEHRPSDAGNREIKDYPKIQWLSDDRKLLSEILIPVKKKRVEEIR